MEDLLGKGEEELGKIVENPNDVARGKAEADKVLGKYVDQGTADKITTEGESLLEKEFGQNRGS